jgi:hypothetical protein
MRSRLGRLRPTPGVVLAAIAVFFAIAGIGYAATKIGTNQIKNGAVTGKKLHKNAVTSPKVKNHSLKKADLAFNAAGATGPQGPQGPPGSGTGGAVKFDLRANSGTPLATLYNAHGLSIEGNCNLGTAPNIMRLNATTNNNSIVAGQEFLNAANPSGLQGIAQQAGTPQFFNDWDFDAGDSVGAGNTTDRARLGWVEFAGSDGSILTIQYNLTIETGQPQGDCVISGTVLAA